MKRIGYLVIIGIILMAFMPLVSADKVNITVANLTADGYIQQKGNCNPVVSNSATTMIMGVDGRNKCLPPSGTAVATNSSVYMSFNTSVYQLCSKSSAKVWYYVSAITTYPRTTPFPWNAGYSSNLDYIFRDNKIGPILEIGDYWFGNNINGSLASMPSAVGWYSITMDIADIANTSLTDIEIRPNKDFYDEMNTDGTRYELTVRTTEYTGTTYDPVLELTYSDCLTNPTVNITSPLNITYTENPIWLNWTYNITTSGASLSSAWYSLDGGANVSLWGFVSTTEQDEEDAWWNTSAILDVENCVDENWDTFGTADEMCPWSFRHICGQIHENFTILSNKANLTSKIGYVDGGDLSISCWNGTDYEYLIENIHSSESNIVYYNNVIPPTCLDESDLIINTSLSGLDGFYEVRYYESKVTWIYENWTNTSLTLAEGNHTIVVCINDSNSMWGCDSEAFNLFFKQQPQDHKLALILSFFGSGAFLLGWKSKLDDEHYPLKVLFLMIAMLLFLAMIHVMDVLDVIDLGTHYAMFLYTTIATMAIILILFIRKVVIAFLINKNNPEFTG